MACEDVPWCESRVVAVKGNDHNEFGLHESTTNRLGSGLSANGHLLYVRCPIHTAERQCPRICEQNNTKLGWYVSRNEARPWKAETFSMSRISYKIQPRCSRYAGCLDVGPKPGLKDYVLSKTRNTELCIRASRQTLMRLCLERHRGSDLGIFRSLKTCTVGQKLKKNWNSS